MPFSTVREFLPELLGNSHAPHNDLDGPGPLARRAVASTSGQPVETTATIDVRQR
jgi:hypothetical protein